MSEELIKDLFTYGLTFFVGYLTGRTIGWLYENIKDEDEVSE